MSSALRMGFRRLGATLGFISPGFKTPALNISTRQIPTKLDVTDAYGTKTIEATPQDLYGYSAQRWVWDEPAQLQSRYAEFDFNSLVRLAERTAGNDAVCSRVTKLPEGNFNKAFMVTMKDGRQLIVKIPNPNSGFKMLTTASEAATMTYEGALNHFILWHNDIHADNIFVNEDDPSQITSIIDWQGVSIYPTFLTARHPTVIEHDWPKPDDFVQPTLPSNISDLDAEEQELEKKRYLQQSLWVLYEVKTQLEAPDLLYTFRYADTIPCQILRLIGATFDDGEAHIQNLLANVTEKEEWEQVVGSNQPCPIHYSAEELKTQELQHAKWARDVQRKSEILTGIGAYPGWDGAVEPQEYDIMLRKLERAKGRFLDEEAKTAEERRQWEDAWPVGKEISRTG